MLKPRIICTLLWNGQTLGITTQFGNWRPVGQPLQAINVFQLREVDEILFLDITATSEGRHPDCRLIESLARECFVPLTVGGGVQSVDDVRDLLNAGADKVSIRMATTALLDSAQRFGAQAVVHCVDYRETVIRPIPEAGEWLLHNVAADGTMQGYGIMPPIRLPDFIWDHPVIVSGGAGTYAHFAEALRAGASACAAGAMWYFTEQTPREAKAYLAAEGFPVRT